MYIKASFTGYDTKIANLVTHQYGTYTADFVLSTSRTGALRIQSLVTDKAFYLAYEPVTIQAEVQNDGATPITGYVRVLITDEHGSAVSIQEAVWVNNGTSNNQFNFLPGINTSLSAPWETGYQAPGIYSVTIYISTEEYGMVIAEMKTDFVIAPTQAIGTLTVSPQPAYTNLDATEQVSIQANLMNLSNVSLDVGIAYDLLSPSGAIVHSGSGIISLLPEESTKSVIVETFPYTFSVGSGSYTMHVRILNGPSPVNIIGKPVSVAPGIRIDPTQSIAPMTVVPDGDKRIHLNIHLKGVELK
jgi:hypothetical protein